MLIHILSGGAALCGKEGFPRDWGDADRWVHLEHRHEATCPRCLGSEGELSPSERARRLIERADRGEGRFDVKVVVDHLRAASSDAPERPARTRLGEDKATAIRGLLANEGRTLLQLLFAWRAQGSLSHWSTAPSKALALFADHLRREYPNGSAAAGTKDLDFRSYPTCDYDDCDAEPSVTLPGEARMCSHHAAVSLLGSMSPDEARSTFKYARPVPENPWANNDETRDDES